MSIKYQSNVLSSYSIKPKKDFDSIALTLNGSMTVLPAKSEQLPEALAFVRNNIPGKLASIEVAREILTYNRDNIYLTWRGSKLVGVYAMIMLNHIGLERLLLGEFDPHDPERVCLSMSLATPSAIYKWAVVAPGMASQSIRHVSQILQKPRYSVANLYAHPTTLDGRRIMENLGFEGIPAMATDLYRYERKIFHKNPSNKNSVIKHAA